ncbi:hypothetical protein FOYG_10331 [Fusarium oxysporum NRRL 32931]|uniref:Uncharacterized protein n=1 Tax=Fusarium oxysporum NRRL 32931 TaxID=660029 RepID=W9I4G2_FUSOX|nr:hypothetical protein FOYG_10331 [Fusarium oxysporum NRRL 32931]
MNQQVEVANERWYAIGIGLLVGITTIWDRFPFGQAAEEWLNVMQRQHLQLFPHFLPQYPNLGDIRTIKTLKDLAFLPAASNGALASGSRALPASSSSPDDPVFSPHAPYTRHKSGNSYEIVIDRTSDSDDAKPFSSRPRPTAVPSSSSAAPSSASSTAAETSTRTARLAQSPGQARSSKRARRTSGDDTTLGSSTADISGRFVNILPALLRLVDIFSNGNAVIITEARNPTPGDDERRSDTLMGLYVSGAYNIPDIEETGCPQKIVKGTGKAKVNHEP